MGILSKATNFGVAIYGNPPMDPWVTRIWETFVDLLQRRRKSAGLLRNEWMELMDMKGDGNGGIEVLIYVEMI